MLKLKNYVKKGRSIIIDYFLLINQNLNILLFAKVGEAKDLKRIFYMIFHFNKMSHNWQLKDIIYLFNYHLINGVPASDMYMTVICDYYKKSR